MSLRNVSRIPVHTGLAAWSEILGPARRRAPLGASTGCDVAIVGAGFAGLSAFVQALHTRNVFQVLGPSLDSPAEFVLCWTADGEACEASPDE